MKKELRKGYLIVCIGAIIGFIPTFLSISGNKVWIIIGIAALVSSFGYYKMNKKAGILFLVVCALAGLAIYFTIQSLTPKVNFIYPE